MQKDLKSDCGLGYRIQHKIYLNASFHVRWIPLNPGGGGDRVLHFPLDYLSRRFFLHIRVDTHKGISCQYTPRHNGCC